MFKYELEVVYHLYATVNVLIQIQLVWLILWTVDLAMDIQSIQNDCFQNF